MSTDTELPIPAVRYTEENMKSLKDAAHIRQNPGMYVGNTQSAGLHHLVYEIVSNSVDEALAGYCKQIRVTLHKDGSISVADDGRGIPVGIKKDTGKSALEEALTVAGNSGKFDNDAYRFSVGLHGMGAKAMTALSEWCEAEVRRDGRVYKMEFEKGYATSALQDLGPSPGGQTGTTITFKPDSSAEMFGDLTFDHDTLADRFREIAYLCKGLAITLVDERDGRTESFRFDGGIAEYVIWLNQGETAEHAPIYVKKEVEYNSTENTKLGLRIAVEVALQYTTAEEEKVRCYTNNAYNPVGGTHMSGFRSGLTRAINTYGKKEGHFKPEIEVRGEDFRSGLTAVVSIGHPDPLFESQTKIKLNNPEVEGIVSSVVYEFLTEYLEKNPKEAAAICKRIGLAAELRLAAKKARDALLKQKELRGGGLPGKLFDCTTRDREKNELFLVEGDSAGGSAESGRDRMYQAVLPLRGKVLNVEKARFDKLLKNNEISALIAATGINIQNVEDVSEVRYGKIIILTDADVDGQHIRTLLLTFFFRQMRKLIEAGHVYVARPPLYKVTQKKEARFIQTREEMTKELTARGLKDTVLLITKSNPTREVKGDDLAKLLPMLAEAETAVVNLERRGHTLESFLARAKEGVLPTYHVRFRGEEFWFNSQADVEEFRDKQFKKLGKELVLADTLAILKHESGTAAPSTPPTAAPAPATPGTPPTATPPAEQAVEHYTLDEWHEVRTLNRVMAKLRTAEFNFEPGDLILAKRIAGREPPTRFVLQRDDSRKELSHLLMLVTEIRRLGEKGISVTRFKGLGEMDPEELWATTLDPKHRTLLRVTLTDALKAEELFRTLMGEEVEGRKAFIMNRTITNLEDIDYGA
jgi:DNA gyrase subunit B